LKPIAEPFDRDAYQRFVDTTIHAHPPGIVARANGGASASMKPVFVVGVQVRRWRNRLSLRIRRRKAPVNSDYLGVIHSVFPNARIIYMQRDPIDTCLSCYFQKFVLSLNFTMDLSDLADYYRQHQRLMAHWRAVLPRGTILDVPYEELVTDQEGWTRKILDFLGLEWDKQVLDFHTTQRAVVTASFWQVRQKIFKNSVQRWRHYEKFIGPLLDLKNLAR
jgi:hypothetical protein